MGRRLFLLLEIYRLVRRRVVNNFRNKLKNAAVNSFFAPQPISRDIDISSSRQDFGGALSKLRSVLTSYLAYSSKANSFRIVIKTLHPHQWLKQFFKLYRTKAEILENITLEHKSIITNFF